MSWLDRVPDSESQKLVADALRAQEVAEHERVVARAIREFELLPKAFVKAGKPAAARIVLPGGELLLGEPGWLIRWWRTDVEEVEGSWRRRTVTRELVSGIVVTERGEYLRVSARRRELKNSHGNQLERPLVERVTAAAAFDAWRPGVVRMRDGRIDVARTDPYDGTVRWVPLDDELEHAVKTQ